jgi:hypothetical protein
LARFDGVDASPAKIKGGQAVLCCNSDERKAKESGVIHHQVVRFRDEHRACLCVQIVREWLAQRVNTASGARARFENRHFVPGPRQLISGGKSGESCSEDDNSFAARARRLPTRNASSL